MFILGLLIGSTATAAAAVVVTTAITSAKAKAKTTTTDAKSVTATNITNDIKDTTVTDIIVTTNTNENKDINGDDNFKSLFYSSQIQNNGQGIPYIGTCDLQTLQKLKTIHNDYKFLSKEFYSKTCENLVITCVDIILQRKYDNKLLLFYRRDPPAANIWWWPGGRMFRETFADTAIRKIKDETGGIISAEPISIIDVWNTFFPDSSWDKDRYQDKVGTQTMNVVIFCKTDWKPLSDVNNINVNGEVKDWAVEAQRWISVDEAISIGAYDKYVSLNVRKALKLGLLD